MKSKTSRFLLLTRSVEGLNEMPEKTLAERVGTMERTVERLAGVLDGTFGRKGLTQTVTDFMAAWDSRENDRKLYDDKNRYLLNLIVAIMIALFTLACAGATIWVYERTTHSRLLSDHQTSYTAREDAGLK